MGDASADPRNYLGMNVADYIPTHMIPTSYLEAPCDDWYGDLDEDGVPELAVGRLPVRSAAEAAAVVAKLAGYRRQQQGDWRRRALLVSDINDASNFELASENIGAELGAGWDIRNLHRGKLGSEDARSQLFSAIDSGTAVVNYFGHGSIDLWNGNLFTSADADALMNKGMLPLFVMMNCLNGYFADVYSESLGEALVRSAHGGGIAVWASSGLSDSAIQLEMAREAFRLLKQSNGTLGEAVRSAKRAVTDENVRRTWVLLGDPTLASPLAAAVEESAERLVISQVAVSDIAEAKVSITWRTNKAATGQVEYGITDAYGSASRLNGSLETAHMRILTGLSAGTEYHFRVSARDSEGNAVQSDDYTFRTAGEASGDPEPPGGLRAANPRAVREESTGSESTRYFVVPLGKAQAGGKAAAEDIVVENEGGAGATVTFTLFDRDRRAVPGGEAVRQLGSGAWLRVTARELFGATEGAYILVGIKRGER